MKSPASPMGYAVIKRRVDMEGTTTILSDVRTWGSYQGKKDLVKYLDGKVVSRGLSIKAKCYDCMGGYSDGAMDCELVRCPLYPYMPYRGKALTRTQVKSASSGTKTGTRRSTVRKTP